mgnify:FL=1
MNKFYFECALNGEKMLGPDYKFTFPKFGVWAETKEEAVNEVREWQKEFIQEVKAKQKKVKDSDEPFETPTEVNGVKMLKNTK